MDDDIKQHLQDMSAHVQRVGRMVQSPMSSIEDIETLAECLDDAAKNLRMVNKIRILRMTRTN